MMRSPDWTKQEFEILLSNNLLKSDEFVAILPNRSKGAIDVVRQGLHEFHQKGESSLLSNFMKQHIVDSTHAIICPICSAKVSNY